MMRFAAILLAITVFTACGVEAPSTRCRPGEVTPCFCAASPSLNAACLPDGSGFAECRCPSCSCGTRVCGVDNCGNSCGGCPQGFMCSSAGSCDLDSTSRWRFVLSGALLSPLDPNGAPWDSGSGPDLFVCTTIEGTRQCTNVVNDSFEPVWFSGNMFIARASSLMAPGPSYEVNENDPIVDERICSGPVPVELDSFRSGRGAVACGNAVRISYTLVPVD